MSSNGRIREPNPSHVVEDLSAYLDGELDRAGRSRVEAHLSACDSCALELRTLQQTKLLMSRAPRMVAPRRFTIREMDVVAARPQPRMRWGTILARAAAPVVAVMLFIVAAGDVLTHRTTPAAMPAPVAFTTGRQSAEASGPAWAPSATMTQAPLTARSLSTVVPTMAKSQGSTLGVPATTAPTHQPASAVLNTAPPTAPTTEPQPTISPEQAAGMGAAASPEATQGAPTATPESESAVGLAAMPSETEVSSEAATRIAAAPPGKGGAAEATATEEPPAKMASAPVTATAIPPATPTLRPPAPTGTAVVPTRVASTAAATASSHWTATATLARVTMEQTGEPIGATLDSDAKSDEGHDSQPQLTNQDLTSEQALDSPLLPSWAWRAGEVVLGCALVGLLLVVFFTSRGRA